MKLVHTDNSRFQSLVSETFYAPFGDWFLGRRRDFGSSQCASQRSCCSRIILGLLLKLLMDQSKTIQIVASAHRVKNKQKKYSCLFDVTNNIYV